MKLMLFAILALPLPADWETERAAGIAHFQAGRHAEAEQHLRNALIESQSGGAQDIRVITSLRDLAALYQAQVRYLEAESEEVIEAQLKAQPICSYENNDGELVTWPLVGVLAAEPFSHEPDGSEVVGFITGCHEFVKWAHPQSRVEVEGKLRAE